MRALGRLGASGAAGVLLATAVAGSAWGYFAAGGLGSGAARTATDAPVTLVPGTVSASLAPGGRSDVVTVVTNDGPAPVRIVALALDTGSGDDGYAVDAAHRDCPVSAFSYRTQDGAGQGWTVPARGSLTLTLPDALGAATDTPNACQGATVAVHLRATR